MKKLKLTLEELTVVSFETQDTADERRTVQGNMVTSTNNCTTRYPTIVGSCCTPLV